MLRKVNEDDFCPKCTHTESLLYMGKADFDNSTVEFRCALCDYVDIREVKVPEI